MPFEFIKKTMMTGVGIALKTQAEFEEMTKAFIEKSRMSEEEGRRFVEEMLDKYQDARQKMEDQIEESVKKMLDKTDLVSRKELLELKKEIAELRAMVIKNQNSNNI